MTNKFTPVSEGLPKTEDFVAVVVADPISSYDIGRCIFESDGTRQWMAKSYGYTNCVTHWMELPELPED